MSVRKTAHRRLVPVDADVRRIVSRILALRSLASPAQQVTSDVFLLPRRGGPFALFDALRATLAAAAKRAGCSCHVTPHQLRHSYATEMLRLGISLPALMQLLGHKDIRMTLRYVQVTQRDLQREFHLARQQATPPHRLPALPLPDQTVLADIAGIRQALAATRHLIEMYRRAIEDQKTCRHLQRLDKRLLNVASALERIGIVEK